MVDGHGWNEVKEENARNACRTARQAIDHSAFRGIAQEARAGGQREGGPARRPGQRNARAAHRSRADCGRHSQPGERSPIVRDFARPYRGALDTVAFGAVCPPNGKKHRTPQNRHTRFGTHIGHTLSYLDL
ncbi:hypothetical protein KTE29_16315 [Burkholderia multivorans]|nr:hypothetical protein [Burkholderia multivorans]MBR7892672.1 hypothetical protein [Burkholderia multivorans]MBR8451443.1 hypothetical protein [Burkholderia multivorans]MBU9449334.1 hypothetical protein [Burkholderia multivorans]PRG37855.1 hypothetical protein C6T68_13750 [Burkholderia multivorans]